MLSHKLRATEAAYKFVGSRFECAYCGDVADTVDHCTPASVLRSGVKYISRYRFFKVACCRDCNGRAGHVIDETFIDRRKRIAKSVREANKRLLSIPAWDDEEMNEIGFSLNREITKFQRKRHKIIKRLAILDTAVIGSGIPNVLIELVKNDEGALDEDKILAN